MSLRLVCLACGEKEFRCVRGKCVPASAMCDGKFHCVNGEDEDERLCRIFFSKFFYSFSVTTVLIYETH